MRITRDDWFTSGVRWTVEISDAEMMSEPLKSFLAWVQIGLDLFSTEDAEGDDDWARFRDFVGREAR